MNKQEQRIAIAEACGLSLTLKKFQLDADCLVYYPNGQDATWEECPDYLNDLNAMHEAEKVLTESHQGTMIDFLVIVERQEGWNAFHATAAQRAEAFLKTLNLWK